MGCGASRGKTDGDDGAASPASGVKPTASAQSGGKPTAPASNGDVIRIFSINDVYKLDNMARLKTCIDDWNDKNGKPTKQYVTLNGDLIGGCLLFTLDKGSSIISICNEIGVDFLCLGNHEFDHGLNQLEQRIGEFKGQWLNSNVQVKAEGGSLTSSAINQMPRYYIDTLPNGSKIGFFGVCTTESPSLALKDPTLEGVVFNDVHENAKHVIENELKDVNAIIAVTHLSNVDDQKLLNENPRINACLGGHDHVAWKYETNEADGNQRIAVKSGLDAENVDILDFKMSASSSSSSTLKLLKHTLVPLEDKKKTGVGYEANPCIAKQIEDHKKILSDNDFSLFEWAEYDEYLKEWSKYDETQAKCWTTVGIRSRQCNFFSLCSKWLKAEMVVSKGGNLEYTCTITNSGNFRSNLDYDFSPKMSFNDVNKELAFNNVLMKVKLSGNDILSMIRNSETERKGQGGYLQYDLDSIKVDFGERNTGFPANAGLSTNDAKFRAQLDFIDDITIVSVNGKPFEAEKLYTVILVCKMLDGMDNWPLLSAYGKKLPNLQEIIDSAPGMGTLVVNHLLKENWKKVAALLPGSTSLSGNGLNIEELKKAYTELRASKEHCTKGENTDMAVQAMFDMLDTNKDGVVCAQELADLSNPANIAATVNPRSFVNLRSGISPNLN